MAGEVQFGAQHLTTNYFVVRNRISQIWNNNSSAFETYSAGNWSLYVITATEQGGNGYFIGNFPSTIIPGIYSLSAHQQFGGSPAETDLRVAAGDYQWNGSVTLPLSDLATSGQISNFAPVKLAYGNPISGFGFNLVSNLDHITPFTSGTCSGQICRNPTSGSVFVALTNPSYAEVGYGGYSVNLTSGDLLCQTALLRFTASSPTGGVSDPKTFSLVLQHTSGN